MNKEFSSAIIQEIISTYPEINFLQLPKYGKMNELIGDKTIIEDFGGKAHALMIVRNAKRGRYLEIPCGPLLDWNNKKLSKDVFDKIAEIGKREKCIFVRIRPQLNGSPENLKKLADLKLEKSPMHLAAEHTVMIDLRKTEDELLADMRRQTRYEVRRAEKLNIHVDKSNSLEVFKEFHSVQTETARRQNFVPPSLKTLLAEREAFGDDIMIYVAKNEDDKPIAYGMIIRGGKEGDYYEAASTELNHKLPGAYALLWQAMKDLKADGYERFNLWGIAPPNQPNHRYAGVTTFKTGFGGEVVEYVPAHDLVLSKVRYLADFAFETLRKKRRHL